MTPQETRGTESWEARLVSSARHYAPRVWRASTSESLAQAQRYGTFVKVMKRALPLAAVALALAVVVYALQPREKGRVALTFERMGKIENDLAMIRPRLTGTDNEGLPFVVTAESATPENAAGDTVRLDQVKAEMLLKDGTSVHLTAAKGLVDSKAGRLDVSGGIRFSADGGYSAETISATADLKSGTVRGDLPVIAVASFGHLTANSFTFDKDTRLLRFQGDVRTVLTGSAQ